MKIDTLTKGFSSLGEAFKSTSEAIVMQGQQNVEHMMESNKIMMGGIFAALNTWATETTGCSR
eukprot:4149380-Karenia_brevis.AAC.1